MKNQKMLTSCHKIKKTWVFAIMVIVIIGSLSSAAAQVSAAAITPPVLMIVLEEKGDPFADCKQLIIANFSSSTGFPATIPDPFHIGLVEGCPAFLSGATIDGKSTDPRTQDFANAAVVEFVTYRGSGTSSLNSFVTCSWSPIPGLCRVQNQVLSAFEFATDQGFSCTGPLNLTGSSNLPAQAFSQTINLICIADD